MKKDLLRFLEKRWGAHFPSRKVDGKFAMEVEKGENLKKKK